MKKYLVPLFFLILVYFMATACDPIKRHARLVNKFPHVHTAAGVKVIYDTIRIHSSSSDTIVHNNTLIDTIHLVKDRLDVKVYRIRDSVYIQGNCDSLIIPKQYTYNQYKTTKPYHNWWLYSLLILIVLLILLIFRANLKK